MSDFKKIIKEHYLTKQLSTEQLARLQEKKRFSLWRPAFLSACIAVFCVSVFLTSGNFTTNVMQEIAYNHSKNLDVEIRSDDLLVIQDKLGKLDFLVAQSSRFPAKEWEIVGARYCSIQGKIAVQIKLKNRSNGQLYTHYQTRLNDDKLKKSATADIDGAKVQVWMEKGLLMGVAGP